MTKNTLRRWVLGITTSYIAAVISGVALRLAYPSKDAPQYGTYKDLVPLIVAVPAAWLGFCFQRRSAFLQQLRSTWPKIVDAVQTAVQYTLRQSPTEDQYLSMTMKLSAVVDELRGVFRNLPAGDDPRGIYPFESLNNIHQLMTTLGSGSSFKQERADTIRGSVLTLWRRVQSPFLHEFELETPTKYDSPFVARREVPERSGA